MTYGKLVDGVLTTPPHTYTRGDGTTVIGYSQHQSMLIEDGWCPVVNTPKPDGYFMPQWHEIDGTIIQSWLPFDPPPPLPFTISKIKVLKALDEMGALDTFLEFIDADPKRKLFWDAAVVLDSDDELVTTALPQLATALGLGDVSGLLEACRSDLGV